jgi:hypothetical protein
MSYHLFSKKDTVARKIHRCVWCGETIAPGSTYRYEVSVYDGTFQNHHWHPECDDDAGSDGGDFEFIPHDNERPVMTA